MKTCDICGEKKKVSSVCGICSTERCSDCDYLEYELLDGCPGTPCIFCMAERSDAGETIDCIATILQTTADDTLVEFFKMMIKIKTMGKKLPRGNPNKASNGNRFSHIRLEGVE